jgi:natural product biosynthesis luciferase-like monooxygenase protein
MRFSLFYFASDEGNLGNDKYRLLIEGAKFADEHGFEAVWVPERHFHPFGGLYPNPALLASAVAMVTKRIRVRAGSVVLPLHSPIRVAEEWAVVDNLSAGRVDLAFARGWNANDFVLMPSNYANALDVLYRDLKTVRSLWRGETITLPNGEGKDSVIKVYPLPRQPELPIWITCTGGLGRFVEAGEGGWNILTALLFQSVDDLGKKIMAYREARARNGYNPNEGHVTLMLHTYLGAGHAQVKEKVHAPFTEYLKSSVDLWRQHGVALGALNANELEQVLKFAFERYYRTSALFGTPDTCIDMVQRLAAVGVDEIACLIDFGVDVDSVLSGLGFLHVLKEGCGSMG